MAYRNNITGKVFTEDEIRKAYEDFKGELKFEYDSFEDYLEAMCNRGDFTEVEQDELEEELAGELFEMVTLGWTDDEARADEDAFFERIGTYANGLTDEDVWRVWSNVWEESQVDHD